MLQSFVVPMQQTNADAGAKQEKLALFIVFAGLFLFHLYLTLQTAGPVILDDEIGYLANAAHLAGVDWSDAVGKTYYAFGYSLLLIPFFLIFSDGRTIYHAALIVNGVCASSVFILAYCVGKQYAPLARKTIVGLAAVTVSLYPSTIVYAQTALSESLLVLAYWVTVLLTFYLVEKKPTGFLVLGIVEAFLFAIHQRALCMIASSTFILLLLCYQKRISTRTFLVFMSTVMGLGALIYLTHGYFRNDVWGLNIQYRFGARVGGALLDLQGLKTWLEAACGQLFYLGVATALISFIGLGFLLRQSISFVRPHVKTHLSHSLEQTGIPSLYILSSFVLTFLLSVTFCYKGTANFVVYGRYNEAVIGPLILIGLLTASGQMGRVFTWRALLACIVLLFGIALPVYFSRKLVTGPTFNIQIIGLSLFKKTDWHIAIWQAFLGSAFFSVVLFALLKKHPRIGMVATASLFLIVAREGIRDHVFAGAEAWKQMTNITGWLDQHHNGESIFFLSRGSWQADLMKKRYQIWLNEKKIKTIRNLNEVKARNRDYLITSRTDLKNDIPEARLIAKEKNGSFSLYSLSKKQWIELDQKGVIEMNHAVPLVPSYPEEALPLNAYHSSMTLRSNRSLSIPMVSPEYLWMIARFDMIENVSGIRASLKDILADSESFSMRISHQGSEACWSRLIRLGIIWQPGDGSGRWLGEQRATLPSVLCPGENTEVDILLEPVDYHGRPLPEGQYTAVIDLVHEKVSWFHSRGNEPLKLDIQVVKR